jgi:hypothetical protein
MKRVTAIGNLGQTVRVRLPKPFWEGKHETTAGMFITALYWGPQTNRCVVERHSIWQSRNGGCEGRSHALTVPADFAQIAERCGAQLPEAFDERNAEEL